MLQGKFYFINDEYYEKFNSMGLLENRETINEVLHGRPCYYAFKEQSDSKIYWMIPISSKIDKYQKEYKKSKDRYGFCDSISFGYILGEKKAFLIQNICPVIDRYITNIYIDKNTSAPVTIPLKLRSELNAKARKALRLYRKGIKIVLTNILDIEKVLVEELEIEDTKKEVAATDKE